MNPREVGTSEIKHDDYGYHPRTLEELTSLLSNLVKGGVGYESSAEALLEGTVATFNYLASEMGNTGFQASWAALHMIGKIEDIKGPFGILKAETMIYPQYPTAVEQAKKWQESWKDWLAKEAKRRLDEFNADPIYEYVEDDGTTVRGSKVAPRVVEHWEKLARG